MAHLLDITDGTTTVNLATGGGDLLHYVPSAPNGDKDITESAAVHLSGATLAVVRGYVNDLEKLFAQAEYYQKHRAGDRVYVHFQPSGDSDLYRSEVLGGRVVWGASALAYEWANVGFDVSVIWTRRHYWEGPESVVTCTNKAGTSTASVTASTISFTTSTNTIADSASGLTGFAVGDYIAVRGSTSNDGPFLVSSVAGAPANIVVDGTNTPLHADEAAGASVTITKAVTVYNHSDSDASHGNYVDVADSAISAVAETPVRLEIINTYNSTVRAWHIVVGKAALMDASAFSHIVEGEDEVGGLGTTTSGDSAYSGSAYETTTWTEDTEQTILNWTLSSALLNTAKGHYFHALIRYGGGVSPTGVKLRLKIYLDTSLLWDGTQVVVPSNEYQTHLGSFRLPPNLYGSVDTRYLDFMLTGEKTGGGTVKVDYIQLTPTESYRRYINNDGTALKYCERLVDDVFTDNLFLNRVAAGQIGKVASYVADGAPLTLLDGHTNRFYFVHCGHTGLGSALRTLGIILRYRPRRLTL